MPEKRFQSRNPFAINEFEPRKLFERSAIEWEKDNPPKRKPSKRKANPFADDDGNPLKLYKNSFEARQRELHKQQGGTSSHPGIVYILSNPSMAGKVKIGFTTRELEKRVAELSRSGSPAPYRIEHSVTCRNAKGLEKAVHEELREFRVRRDREFFRISVASAIETVSRLLRNYR